VLLEIDRDLVSVERLPAPAAGEVLHSVPPRSAHPLTGRPESYQGD
jgi:hypothetical protein